MSAVVKRILGESVGDKETVLPVIEASRPVTYLVCPHCQQEIHEKHTWIDGDFMSGNYVERHSDCGGAIQLPKTKVDPAWAELLKK